MKTELRCSQEEHWEEKFPHKLYDDDKAEYTKKNCKGPGVLKELPYEDWTFEDLAAKIDNEGFDYFWTSWASLAAINDDRLRELADTYVGASEALQEYLREKGGLL